MEKLSTRSRENLACEIHRLLAYFFFQAEDGIRDLTVTGVQTCALPICGCHFTADRSRFHRRTQNSLAVLECLRKKRFEDILRACGDRGRRQPNQGKNGRSEERRVGKRGRIRGAPDHLKKKKNNIRREQR